MDYFIETKKILNKLNAMLKSYEFDTALLIGGGYAYDSIKYKNTGKMGDIDCLCIVDSPEHIYEILANEKEMMKAGFDMSRSDTFYLEDIDLYKNKHICLVRYSGINNGIKTGLKFLTFDTLNELYETTTPKKSYIVSHNSNNCIFIAKGTDSHDILLTTVSLDISNLYQDSKAHYLWPYYTWYKNGLTLHAGAWTDFIAKGIIVKDTLNNEFLNIQQKILEVMVLHSSSEIYANKTWHLMFANNHYFSEEFRISFNNRISEIAQKILRPTKESLSQSEIPTGTLLTIAPDIYDLELIKQPIHSDLTPKQYKTSELTSLYDLLFEEKEIGYEEILHMLNAEGRRLTSIYNSIFLTESCSLTRDQSIQNLLWHLDDYFIYINQGRELVNGIDKLLESTFGDFKYYNKINIASKKQLLRLLTEFRVNIIIDLCNKRQESIIKLLNHFSTEFKELFGEKIKMSNITVI